MVSIEPLKGWARDPCRRQRRRRRGAPPPCRTGRGTSGSETARHRGRGVQRCRTAPAVCDRRRRSPGTMQRAGREKVGHSTHRRDSTWGVRWSSRLTKSGLKLEETLAEPLGNVGTLGWVLTVMVVIEAWQENAWVAVGGLVGGGSSVQLLQHSTQATGTDSCWVSKGWATARKRKRWSLSGIKNFSSSRGEGPGRWSVWACERGGVSMLPCRCAPCRNSPVDFSTWLATQP